MANRKSDFTLPTFDDIFSTQEQRDDAKLSKIRDIPISEIDDFPDHLILSFSLYSFAATTSLLLSMVPLSTKFPRLGRVMLL